MSSLEIAPEYSFRFTDRDIKATYQNADGAFADGDFLTASQFEGVDPELRACSWILGGLLEQGLSLSERLPNLSGRTRLCRAFAYWSLNRVADAKTELAHVTDAEFAPAAKKLLALMDRDNVNIFITGAILSVFPEHYSPSFIAPSYKYGAITVKYVGSQLEENAYEYSPTDPIDKFIDSLPAEEKPDILFALSPQWLLPKDFHEVSVPKVIWCHDTDAFHNRNIDNFALYDVAICNCSQEHFELSQGTPGLYCAANMLLHPLATPFPEASPHGEKTIDIVFTGSALAPFHSEKPRFLYKLSELGSEFRVMVVEGHLPEKDYFALISKAKFLPVVNRYAGSPSPRWRDALSNGSYLLYPEGSFYGEIAPGCFSYKAETMIEDTRRNMRAFNAQKDPAYDLSKVVPVINERFAIHRQPREQSYERLLKYALFMGLVWRHPPAAPQAQHRRLVWLTPAVDCGVFGTEHVRDLIKGYSDSIGPDDLVDDVDYNNAAHLNAQYVYTFHESKDAEECGARAERYFAEGLRRFPDSLLLLFNQAHWNFLRPNADHAAAADMFRAILTRFDTLKYDVLNADVAMPYTLHERDAVFPCYEFADVATQEMVLRQTPELSPVKTIKYATREIIRSSCLGYVAWAKLKAGDQDGAFAGFKEASALYPDGLPMLRLYFDALLEKCVADQNFTEKAVADLAAAYVAVVNINPSILLTHVFVVVPILADNGSEDAARMILAAWHRLANIIYRAGPYQSDVAKIARLAPLWHYRDLFPPALSKRLDEVLWNDDLVKDMTQLESAMIEAIPFYDQKKSSYASRRRSLFWRPKKKKYEDALRSVSTAGSGGDRILYSHLARAVRVWFRAPGDVKRIYVKKAWSQLTKGEIRTAMVRMQQWGVSSRWSTDAMMPPRRESAWLRFIRLLVQRMARRSNGAER